MLLKFEHFLGEGNFPVDWVSVLLKFEHFLGVFRPIPSSLLMILGSTILIYLSALEYGCVHNFVFHFNLTFVDHFPDGVTDQSTPH